MNFLFVFVFVSVSVGILALPPTTGPTTRVPSNLKTTTGIPPSPHPTPEKSDESNESHEDEVKKSTTLKPQTPTKDSHEVPTSKAPKVEGKKKAGAPFINKVPLPTDPTPEPKEVKKHSAESSEEKSDEKQHKTIKPTTLTASTVRPTVAIAQQNTVCPYTREEPLRDKDGSYRQCFERPCEQEGFACWYQATESAYCCPQPKLPKPLQEIADSKCQLPEAYTTCWNNAFNNTVFIGYGGRIKLGSWELKVNATQEEKELIESWQSACAKWPIFTDCLQKEKVDVQECPMTRVIHNLMTNIFTVCDEKRFDQYMMAFNCLSRSLDGDLTEVTQCMECIGHATDDVISSTYYGYEAFCGHLGQMLQCLYPAMQNTCRADAEGHYKFIKQYIGDIMSSIFGQECSRAMNAVRWEDVKEVKPKPVVPSKWTNGAANDVPANVVADVPLGSNFFSLTKDGLLLKAE